MAEENAVIEVRIRELAQLFNSFDPSPSMNATSMAMLKNTSLAGRVNFFRMHRFPFVHLPKDEARKAEERGLSAALVNYFAERVAMQQRELNELFHIGRRGAGSMASLIAESLILVGWVANWKPIETFLYDWWPLKRRRDLYRRLVKALVEIKSA